MGLPHKNLFKIGYKIKAYRLADKLTQEQLADMMNCNFKTIGNLENDRTNIVLIHLFMNTFVFFGI